MDKTNYKISYINSHIDENDKQVCQWLTAYLNTSYSYRKQNFDGSWLIVQPGWKDETVIAYRYYYEQTEGYRKRSRLFLLFESTCTINISLNKFKKWVKKHNKEVH